MTEAILSLVTVGGLLIISQLSPGPDVFFVVRTALAQGFRAGSTVAAGIVAGFAIQTVLVCAVGGWVMEQSWSRYVLWAASAWLLYLAWRIFPRSFAAGAGELEETARRHEPYARLFAQGFLCNILNPKCTLFICGLCLGPLAQFGDAFSWYAPALVVSLCLSAQLGWMLWSGLLQWKPLRRAYMRHSGYVDALFSVLLGAFAVLLILP